MRSVNRGARRASGRSVTKASYHLYRGPCRPATAARRPSTLQDRRPCSRAWCIGPAGIRWSSSPGSSRRYGALVHLMAGTEHLYLVDEPPARPRHPRHQPAELHEGPRPRSHQAAARRGAADERGRDAPAAAPADAAGVSRDRIAAYASGDDRLRRHAPTAGWTDGATLDVARGNDAADAVASSARRCSTPTSSRRRARSARR